jgi:hypothetical protein
MKEMSDQLLTAPHILPPNKHYHKVGPHQWCFLCSFIKEFGDQLFKVQQAYSSPIAHT